MKPREFLDLADELIVGSTEADWRTAASRAYYAAFHVSRMFIESLGFAVPEAESAHHYLYVRLNNTPEALLGEVAGRLRELRRNRNQADYDLAIFYPAHFAAQQVLRATAVVETLETDLAEPTRFPALAAAIAAYERDVLREITNRAPGAPS